MGQNNMDELNIQILIKQYNFIIPEIQREYVWGKSSVLGKFISDIIAEFKKSTEEKKEQKMNIGFLYSYTPHYASNENTKEHTPENGKSIVEDVYLIDGQQRFTSIFLLLFYLAVKSGKASDFQDIFRFDYTTEKIAFDYRVRNITHDFIIQMVERCKKVEDLTEIQSKTWFLSTYKNDVTVQSIISAFQKFEELIPKENVEKLYDYILNHITFWHFKTEATSQGEELYITMNSRGEALEDYENIKAELFEKVEDKKGWGKKWEEWQDFFWKQRGENDENADRGFNEFIKWVKEIEKNKDVKDKEEKKAADLCLEKLESYFESLKTLIENYENINSIYDTIKMPDFSEYLKKDSNDRGKVALYPVLIYIKNKKNIMNDENTKRELFRVIRFFYNVSRFSLAVQEAVIISNKSLSEGKDILSLLELESDYGNILTAEEKEKLKLYSDLDDESRIKAEKAFWLAEDHELNKGKIEHLLSITEKDPQNTTSSFKNIYQNYLKFLDKDGKKIKTEVYANMILSNEYKVFDYCPDKHRDEIIRSKSFLNYITEIQSNNKENVEVFFEEKEKQWIEGNINVNDESEIKKINDPKKQLYIYYLIHKYILDEPFNLSDYDSFNLYEVNDSEIKSIFTKNYLFCHHYYNKKGKDKNKIWLQKEEKLDVTKNYFNDLKNIVTSL